MAKQSKFIAPAHTVRTRRAYFDCQFGQLHVRTAFPATGGFDEGVPLFCLHASEGSSRTFDRFLPEIAEDRSVYAPDLPGCGESDPAPAVSFGAAASAVADLATDLRLRQIDVLGFRFGAGAALELGAIRPELVRRLVLVGMPLIDRPPTANQESLVLRVKLGVGDDSRWIKGILPNARFIDLTEYSADLFDAAPKTLAKQVGSFLST
ncbi:MAG TPA: alpha/beta hydrolase [Steroidobacteraceae bacterium]|nr:alpha/beta hydrolase [Steroidobacteraceae bacterium]